MSKSALRTLQWQLVFNLLEHLNRAGTDFEMIREVGIAQNKGT